jgi:hypothetical protein
MQREKFPEKIPFRLTRMLTKVNDSHFYLFDLVDPGSVFLIQHGQFFAGDGSFRRGGQLSQYL